MNRIIKNFMAISIVFLLLLSIAACAGQSQTSSEGPTTTSSGQTSTASISSQTSETTKDKIKLRVLWSNNVPEFPQGTDENNNEFIEKVKEATGYDFLWELIPKTDGFNKVNLMLSSGDVPDVINMFRNDFSYFASKGMLAPLDDALNEFGANLITIIDTELWNAVKLNDKIYAIPKPEVQKGYQEGFGNHSVGALLFRSDILASLNIKAPTTPEELYRACQTIKEETSMIPIVGFGSPYIGLEELISPFGLANYYSVQNGKVINNWLEPNGREALEFLAKLYEEKLIDPEYPFYTKQNMQEKIVSGQAAMATMNIYDATSIATALGKLDASAKLEFLPPLTGPGGFSGQSEGSIIGEHTMVPAGSKHVNEVIDMIDKFSKDADLVKLIAFGVESRDYNIVDGLYVPTEDSAKNGYRIYYRVWFTPESHFINIKLKGFEPMLLSHGGQGKVKNILNYAPPVKAIEENKVAMEDIFNQYITKIITGAIPLSSYDEFVSAYRTAGGDAVLKELNDWYADEGKSLFIP